MCQSVILPCRSSWSQMVSCVAYPRFLNLHSFFDVIWRHSVLLKVTFCLLAPHMCFWIYVKPATEHITLTCQFWANRVRLKNKLIVKHTFKSLELLEVRWMWSLSLQAYCLLMMQGISLWIWLKKAKMSNVLKCRFAMCEQWKSNCFLGGLYKIFKAQQNFLN